MVDASCVAHAFNRTVQRLLLQAVVVLLTIGGASGGPIEDCNQQEDANRRIKGCSQFIIEQSADKEGLAAAYINRGNAYQSKGEYDRAIADYNKVIELNPKRADAYNNRGRVHEKKQDQRKAIADYRMAVSIDPSSRGAALARDNLKRLGASQR
jgi:tetratricopeptide (TPR) repeat protein